MLFVIAAQMGIPQISPTEPFEKTVVVKTADLDLSSAQGRSVLERRVKSAEKTVCQGDPRTYQFYKEVKDCAVAAWQDASQQLSQLAAGRTVAEIKIGSAPAQ